MLSFWGGILGLVFTAIWIFWGKAPMKRVFLTFFVLILFMSLVLVWLDEYRSHLKDNAAWNLAKKYFESKVQEQEAKLKEQPKTVFRDRIIGQPTEPAKIYNLFAEARVTCSLRDPIRGMPNTTEIVAPPGVGYLEGLKGKSYLKGPPNARWQRLSEEGKIFATMRYDLPSNSELFIEPISSLSNYKQAVIELWPMPNGSIKECVFLEFTLRANGTDLLRYAGAISIAPVDNNPITATIPLKGMKLLQ